MSLCNSNNAGASMDMKSDTVSTHNPHDEMPFGRTPHIIQSAFFGILFSAAVILTVVGTLYSLSDNPDRVAQAYPLLFSNLILIIFLGGYLGLRVWTLLFAKRVNRTAPLLHRRIVLFFSIAALIPAIIVGSFSSSLITRNINDLFGNDVRQTLDGAYSFLNIYVREELRELSLHVVRAERFLEANRPVFDDRISYSAYLQRFYRGLDVDAIYVIDREGVVYARAESPNSPELRIPTKFVFDYIENKGVTAVQTQDEIDYLVGLTQLKNYDGLYLFVGKYLKSNVGVLSSLTGIQNSKRSLEGYQINQGLYSRVFFLTFVEIVLLILFAAVSLGLVLANRVIEPLGKLVYAAEKVRSGDLSARVSVRSYWGEMSDLGSAFNRMTRQLGNQREDLIRERDLSEQERQFSEAVLSGVTAGVIGLTSDGRVTIMNRSAELLTGESQDNALGYQIEVVFPEFAEAFYAARERVSETTEFQVKLETHDGVKNLDLRVSANMGDQQITGWVLTFDDMTRLVAAQRHSAWREVARRIAHEIKNPLTPIQLSAERLRRKYTGHITIDPEVFENCTQTIIRQVGSLEQMVDEFSSFARMPAPEFVDCNMSSLLETVMFEQHVAYPDIMFEFSEVPLNGCWASCDKRLFGQALANIYKNAAISISSYVDEAGKNTDGGCIVTYVKNHDGMVEIGISDNGKGWPSADKERLLEPYVTTHESGTGLGLPIVQRIVEDHSGTLRLMDRPDGKRGAHIRITLPSIPPPTKSVKMKPTVKSETEPPHDAVEETPHEV